MNAHLQEIHGTELLRIRLPFCPDPLAAYQALCTDQPGTALLESASTGNAGTQRSLLAIAPALRITLQADTIHMRATSPNGEAALARLGGSNKELAIAAPPPTGTPLQEEADRLLGPCLFDPLRMIIKELTPARAQDRNRLMLIGALSFELAARFDRGLGAARQETDYVFTLPEIVLEIDHVNRQAELCALVFDPLARNDLARRLDGLVARLEQLAPFVQVETNDVGEARLSCDDAGFRERVARGRDAVCNGEVFQLVLSRYWTLPCQDSLMAYAKLRQANPSPYLFHFRDAEFELFGASPESAVRLEAETRALEIRPIAGTRARGATFEEDARMETELRMDAKEIAEHMMLLDLARNDVARICEPGTRSVPLLLGVDSYAHVMHLVSCVRGRLAPAFDALHALRACMNMGTLSGAPKHRAMQLIREIEAEPRGFYGGAIVVLDAAGNLDSAITIRAGIVRDGAVRIQAGAGVVLDSDPQAEADETRNKARAVIEAVQGARR